MRVNKPDNYRDRTSRNTEITATFCRGGGIPPQTRNSAGNKQAEKNNMPRFIHTLIKQTDDECKYRHKNTILFPLISYNGNHEYGPKGT